jgi:hypothetical protein
MGVSVIVADAVFVGSDLLVAVTVAEVVVTGDGAVYTPAEVMAPVEAVQVTPALAESLLIVAVNVCEAPPISVADVGLTATPITGAAVPPQPAKEVITRKPGRRRASRPILDIECPIFFQTSRRTREFRVRFYFRTQGEQVGRYPCNNMKVEAC